MLTTHHLLPLDLPVGTLLVLSTDTLSVLRLFLCKTSLLPDVERRGAVTLQCHLSCYSSCTSSSSRTQQPVPCVNGGSVSFRVARWPVPCINMWLSVLRFSALTHWLPCHLFIRAPLFGLVLFFILANGAFNHSGILTFLNCEL